MFELIYFAGIVIVSICWVFVAARYGTGNPVLDGVLVGMFWPFLVVFIPLILPFVLLLYILVWISNRAPIARLG